MKKLLSVLLCTMLLVCSLSFTAFAETYTFGNDDGSASEFLFDLEQPEWTNNNEYVIKAGCTFVVPSGRVLNVPVNSTLIVEEGAHLVVNGQLNAVGDVHIYGKLTGNNITGQENILCYIAFPDLSADTVKLDQKITVKYYLSGNDDYYGDVNVPLDSYLTVASDGIVPGRNSNLLPVPYNTYLYVRILINEATGEDRYDDKLFPVKCNGVVVPFAQNACPVLVTTGGEISYGSWVSDSTYYNTYTIVLPEGEGYTVYGRNGEYGTITLKYGQSFSFRVELEEEYDQSAYQVYVYNGTGWTNLEKDDLLAGIEPAVPDAEGYYTINSITGDYSIFVEGVISNQVLDIFGQVFNILRQVWEAVVEIFNELFGEGGLSGLFGQE